MKLLVISHKESWRVGGDVVTTGGFPIQIAALSTLFEETTVITTLRRSEPPDEPMRLSNSGIRPLTLSEPRGTGLGRKALLPFWLLRNLAVLWRALGRADAVHALVPGDVGLLGLALALVRRKRLFIRHCGTWNHQQTLADRLLGWLLPRIAGGDIVVMATGGGSQPPDPRRPQVEWIFATSLTADELLARPWRPRWSAGLPPRLVTLGRLTQDKNAMAVLAALPAIRERFPGASLDIVGDGPAKSAMVAKAATLGLTKVVRFHGNLSHARVLEVLESAHLLVFPTRVAEGFPKAVIEAMACSLPVVATAVSVVPWLLEEGAGVLLDETDPMGVCRCCLAALESEPFYRAMTRAAHSAAQRYSLERWQEKIGERLERAWGPLRATSSLSGSSNGCEATP